MAFKTSSDLTATFARAQELARTLRSRAAAVRAAAAAGTLSGAQLLGFFSTLVGQIATLTALAATPGIADFARSQYADTSYDVVAEFGGVIAAAVAVRDRIVAEFPAAGGYLLREQITAAGVTDRLFGAAQTAGLRADIDALLAAIEG